MKILQVGPGDARDHAVYAQLVAELGGDVAMAMLGGNALLSRLPGVLPVADLDEAAQLADRQRPDLVLMWSPELLLDPDRVRLEAPGRIVLGPDRARAELEGSKLLGKRLFDLYGVPTPAWVACPSRDAALRELAQRWGRGERWIVKADRYLNDAALRTALPSSLDEAEACVERLAAVPTAQRGEHILLERFCAGDELSLHLLLDGSHAVIGPPVADYKRLLDGDRGPNTHGMGAVSASGEEVWRRLELRERIVAPLLRMLRAEGMTYRGVLYVGLLCGFDGPQVLELNVRPGNPEWQTLLARLRRPLHRVLHALVGGTLAAESPFAADVVAGSLFLTHPEYPRAHEDSDDEIELPGRSLSEVTVLGEGIRARNGRLVLGQRRSVCLVARGRDITDVRGRLYRAVAGIGIDRSHHRRDVCLGRSLAGAGALEPRGTS